MGNTNTVNVVEKPCRGCGLTKLIDEFHVHKQMGDGHLHYCKGCVRARAQARRLVNLKNPIWVEKEHQRSLEKGRRIKRVDTRTTAEKTAVVRRYVAKFPEKQRARAKLWNFIRRPGMHLHHWSYKEEHWTDVIELPSTHHKELHIRLGYETASRQYFRKDTRELLDTRENHEAYYESIKHEFRESNTPA